jgi:hypothetical protein
MYNIESDIKDIINIIETRFGELDELLLQLYRCSESVRKYTNEGIGNYEDISKETAEVMNLLISSPIGKIIEIIESYDPQAELQ